MPMRLQPLPGLLGILLLLPAASRSEWVWRSPSTTANTLTALGRGGGLHVAVGKAGTVAISPDGRAWEPVATGLTVDLHEVAYGAGRFVAAGSHGTLAWSADGRRWHGGGRPGAAYGYRSVAWNGRRFIAVSDSPGVPAALSEDGMAWTAGDAAAGGHTHIACSAVLCLATGRPGSIAVTTDGTRWERMASPFADPACGGGVDAVGGDFAVYCQRTLYRTPDGDAWTRVSNLYVSDVAPWRGGLITAGFENISDNGGKEAVIGVMDASGIWTGGGAPFLRIGMNAALGSGDLGLVAGDRGHLFSLGPGSVFAPVSRRVTDENLLAIAGSGSRLVAVGSGMTLLHGTDDSTWTAAPRDPDRHGTFHAVAWSASRFVAVGDAGIAASSDGRDWVWTQDQGPRGLGFGGVVWTGERFIAEGYGKVLVSGDGTEWRTQREGRWGSLAWNGTEAVIITQDSVLASRDGLVWEYRGPIPQLREMPPPRPPDVVGFAGLLLSRGVPASWQDTAHLARSSDGGRTWERVGLAGYPPPLRILAIASGFAVITRGAGGTGVHTLHLSADGLAWSHVDVPMEQPPLGILEDGGKLFVVGRDGALLTSTKALLPFSVGIRKPASQRMLSRPADPRRSRFPWRGRVFNAAGRSSPPP